MWEFTSVQGLNVAVRDGQTCTLVTEDLRTGELCRRYGFDVGQPMQAPPIHPAHRDVGLGRVGRILSFASRQQLAFTFACGGAELAVELDGRRDLSVALRAPTPAPHVRVWLERGRDRVALEPGFVYEVGEGIWSFSSRRPAPAADLSPAEALRQCAWANAVRSPSGALYLPVNRAWVTMFARRLGLDESAASPLVFIWDAAFNSIIAARVDPELALSNLRVLFEQLEPGGRFRQLRVGALRNNLTGLPVASLAVQALFERTREREHLAEFYDRLLAANRWLRAHRDGNGDGLLEWGYEAEGDGGLEVPGRWAPGYESGLDDSPMWQDQPVDEARRCMEASAVCLSSLCARDCQVLAGMARVLGRDDDRRELVAAHARVKGLLDAALWDEARGLYANRRWTGEFFAEVSPTSFFPLLAQIPDRARAARLLAHLEDERSFAGPFRLPSISRSSPRFSASGDYWRGRVWPPLNWLVLQGLRRYDERAAERLAADSRRL